MAVSESNQLKALININSAGAAGPFPDPTATPSPIPTNRHLAGLFPFEAIPEEELPTLKDDYFKAPTDEIMARSAASELPDGKAWRAKVLTDTFMYSLIFGWAGSFNLIRRLIETVAREMNINTTNRLISDHEKSVGLPDSRLELSSPDLIVRRINIIERLKKNPIVTLEEMQDLIDKTLPNSGIWLTHGLDFLEFQYNFQYPLGGGFGVRDGFVIFVNFPEFAEDQISFENLLSWLQDFGNAGILWIQNIIPKDESFVVITNPQSSKTIYSESDGAGGFEKILVKWKQIDKLNTVLNVVDTEEITPALTQITRHFVDTDDVLIDATVTPTVIVL